MLRALWSQLRHRRGRAAAIATGILVASVSFSLLTAATTTSTAEVEGTVARNLRPAYDILVRPPGSITALEASKGLVQANYLSGIFGGITLQQYAQLKRIRGVELAAPIAMIGYILESVTVPVDVTTALTAADAQVLALTDTRTTDRGLTRFPARSAGFVYVTGDPLHSTPGGDTGATETLPTGKHITVCPQDFNLHNLTSPFDDYQAQTGACWSTQNGFYGQGDGEGLTGLPAGHIGGYITVSFPFLVAAIDPTAEQQLVGLGNAVVNGRYLRTADAPVASGSQLQVSVLASTDPFVDDQDRITIARLPASAVTAVRQDLTPGQLATALATLPTTPVASVTVTSQDAYQPLLRLLSNSLLLDAYWTADPTTYRSGSNGALVPATVTNPNSIWISSLVGQTGYEAVPIDVTDAGFRHLIEQQRTNTSPQLLTLHAVGEFDPGKLPGFSTLSQVPLETYAPPEATGANAASRQALGGQPLLPDANMAGYLQSPPLILTTLDSLPAFEQGFPTADATAPISVVRVRVGGLHGTPREQLAQVAQVATSIRRATGLDVDITAGSSPTTETIALSAGRFGRPALTLDESWVRKAVALVLLDAVDGKSLALFVLILIVCGFFLTNATFASVTARRGEIGVLRCLGWPRMSIFKFILGEVLLIGLIAGLTGTGLSTVLIAVLRLEVPWERIALVTPVAVVLAGLAGLVPAWRATRGQPLDAVAPAVRAPRRPRPVRHIAGLALGNLRRTPGRSALAAVALATGIGALTLLLALDAAFNQGTVGSALGEFVASQVRPVDYFSASLAIILGAASVADVLYINLRERASEFAVLSAVGWRRRYIARVAVIEGVGIGVVGSFAGAFVGLVGAMLVLGSDLSLLVAPAAAAFVAGIVVTVAAASIVTASIGRLPLVATLAQE